MRESRGVSLQDHLCPRVWEAGTRHLSLTVELSFVTSRKKPTRQKTVAPTICRLVNTTQRSRIVPRVALDRGALQRRCRAGRNTLTPSSRSFGRTRDANHDETTVHVTIGRLEIRAPQSVPAAAPRRTQTTREGNLEDYLKKRASKGPR